MARSIIPLDELPNEHEGLRALELAIGTRLGVREIFVSRALGKAYVEYDPARCTVTSIGEAIRAWRFEADQAEVSPPPSPADPGRELRRPKTGVRLLPRPVQRSLAERWKDQWTTGLAILGLTTLMIVYFFTARALVMACSSSESVTMQRQGMADQRLSDGAYACTLLIARYGGGSYMLDPALYPRATDRVAGQGGWSQASQPVGGSARAPR